MLHRLKKGIMLLPAVSLLAAAGLSVYAWEPVGSEVARQVKESPFRHEQDKRTDKGIFRKPVLSDQADSAGQSGSETESSGRDGSAGGQEKVRIIYRTEYIYVGGDQGENPGGDPGSRSDRKLIGGGSQTPAPGPDGQSAPIQEKGSSVQMPEKPSLSERDLNLKNPAAQTPSAGDLPQDTAGQNQGQTQNQGEPQGETQGQGGGGSELQSSWEDELFDQGEGKTDQDLTPTEDRTSDSYGQTGDASPSEPGYYHRVTSYSPGKEGGTLTVTETITLVDREGASHVDTVVQETKIESGGGTSSYSLSEEPYEKVPE